ncbi:MAG: FadR/GntR family transcriptional regulator [Myxococcota bacterium]
MSSPQRIFESLRRDILSGQLAPGDRLPPERTLAEQHDTNRNTLREALRKLEQLGLVRARQGQGVTVQDFRLDGTLELLTPFLFHGADVNERVAVLVDLLQARRHVLQSTLKLVAERHSEADMVHLEALAQAQIAASERGDAEAVVRGDIALVDAFFDASHSLTFRWIANSLLSVAREIVERFPALWIQDPTYPEVIATLVVALRARDGDRAADILHSYYLKTDAVLVDMLETIAKRAEEAPQRPEAS